MTVVQTEAPNGGTVVRQLVDLRRGFPTRQEDVSDGEGQRSDDDDDEKHTEDQMSSTASDRKRRHLAILTMHIRDNVAKEAKRGRRVGQIAANVNDEEMSVQELMTRFTDKKIIESPREYQMELFERAKAQNTIAVLDTGAGKTLIAALLVRWMFDQELEHRKAGGKPRLMFFVVGSVALTFQQHGMLSCNLDQKLKQLHGGLNVDQFSQKHWDKITQDHMGVVCTAEVLYQCLTRSFVTVSGINLLIFDEAHHAKKESNFAKIMTEHYYRAERTNRPRIFGMTASPVDAKTDVQIAAEDLEIMLDAKIATIRDQDILTRLCPKPAESVIQYNRAPSPSSKTALTLALQQSFGSVAIFQQFLKKALKFAAELGGWCCDHYWELCFRSEAGEKVENEFRRAALKSGVTQSVSQKDDEMALIAQARKLVLAHTFELPLLTDNQTVSDKVNRLISFLKAQFDTSNKARCIIFVRLRNMAFLLSDLLMNLGLEFLRAAPMVGTGRTEPGELPFSLATQIRTLTRFKKGEINCLLATTIAEEGLDVADCNIIVRFDLCDTMIRYVQSRGRARHKNSKFIHMVERGNKEQEELLKLVRQHEKRMQDFCLSLTEDRLLHGYEDDLEGPVSKKDSKRLVMKSGATLDYNSSLVILHYYIDKLPCDHDTTLQATYIMQTTNNGFVCEVILPEPSPIRSAIGKICAKKMLAKRSAAFMACLRLRKQGLLDDNLMPTWAKKANEFANRKSALDDKRTQTYAMIAKPKFWANSWGATPSRLYITILDFPESTACGRPHSPVAFLTREPLPEIPAFNVYPAPQRSAKGTCTRSSVPLSPESWLYPGETSTTAAAKLQSAVSMLTKFTLQVFRDLFAKTYEHDESRMSYWLAPCSPQWKRGNVDLRPVDMIDWDVVKQVAKSEERRKWQPTDKPADLIGSYIVDPKSGGRRYFLEAPAPELKPNDAPPKGVRPHGAKKYRGTIMDYSCSHYGKAGRARLLETYDWSQPVWRASAASHKRNLLEPWGKQDRVDEAGNDLTNNLAYICLEPLEISSLPAPLVAMVWNLPAFIFRIESHLIAHEACEVLGLQISSALSLEALTKDSDHNRVQSEPGESQVQAVGHNYERLEFLGDAFLKMATSISLYSHNAGDDEFESHVKRMMMICNDNLMHNALDLKLQEYIRASPLTRNIWYPEGVKLLEGRNVRKDEHGNPLPVVMDVEEKKLGDKTVADVCEALIGASYLSYKANRNMDMAVKAVTATVRNPDHVAEKWADYYAAYKIPQWQSRHPDAAQEVLEAECFQKHRYHFKYPRLLYVAFKHGSRPFCWDNLPNYQRLEFLGDALLDLLCVDHLFTNYPDKDPQWLTEHKMAMVSNKFLGFLSVKLGFNRHLRHNSGALQVQIMKYLEEFEETWNPRDPAKSRQDAWTSIGMDPPKCLPDIVEAYLGAIFVDSGYNLREVEAFFKQHILPHFRDMSIYDTFANAHPVTSLANMLTEVYHCQDFRVMSMEVPRPPGDVSVAKVCSAVFIHEKIAADDWSSSSRYGKVRAALKAKADLEVLSLADYRRSWGCDCKVLAEQEMANVITREEQIGSAV